MPAQPAELLLGGSAAATDPALEAGEPAARPTLAWKINRLFEVTHPQDRGPYSNEEVANAIRERGGPAISGSYLWLLRTGKRGNPTAQHIQALARHFDVSPAYFFDSEAAEQIERELELVVAVREAGVERLALHAAGLPADVLDALVVLADQARRAQGLPEPVISSSTGRCGSKTSISLLP